MIWFLLMLVTGFFTLRAFVISIRTAASTDNIGGAMLIIAITGLLGWVTYIFGTQAFSA